MTISESTAHTKECVDALRQRGVRVVQVSVDEELDEEKMAVMFTEYCGYKPDPRGFAADVVKIITEQASLSVHGLK